MLGVCFIGQDEAYRLSETSRQSVETGSGDGDPVQGHSPGEYRRGETHQVPQLSIPLSMCEPIPYQYNCQRTRCLLGQLSQLSTSRLVITATSSF